MHKSHRNLNAVDFNGPQNKGRIRITPGWLAGVISLHGSTAVTIDGRGLSSASPTSRLFAHFRLFGSDALPRWRRSAPPTLGFKNALQKHTSDVTDTTSIFFTAYGANMSFRVRMILILIAFS